MSSVLDEHSGVATDVAAALRDALHGFFGTGFSVWVRRPSALERRVEGDFPPLKSSSVAETLARSAAEADEVMRREIAPDAELLAIPCPVAGEDWIAVAPFLVTDGKHRDHSAWLEGEPEELEAWAAAQTPWTPEALQKMGSTARAAFRAQQSTARLEREMLLVSQNLVSTYEEISLLYTITENLKISRSDEELARLALERLTECIPAEGLVIQYAPPDDGTADFVQRRLQLPIIGGTPPEADLELLAEALEVAHEPRTCVVNPRITSQDSWQFPQIRQMILAPLSEDGKPSGWIAAINHTSNREFGTVEANLLSSLGSLLGIHHGNREHYRQQAEFLANVVRALVTAIDAKDRYTSGHSDRVARFAVRLALELQCDPKVVNTIYMAGLLHDIGKIGIDDGVLRKVGRLTDEEFEHIKMHPSLGHRILADLKQLSDVLPAVLHHHERWDGLGYPHRLAGEEIPEIARIVAVADAYDAMTSDRPYRAGMPDDKVDEIFRDGSGSHWDPRVVEAYFAAKSDILEIALRDSSEVDLLLQELV